jgi:hypothetical protein
MANAFDPLAIGSVRLRAAAFARANASLLEHSAATEPKTKTGGHSF